MLVVQLELWLDWLARLVNLLDWLARLLNLLGGNNTSLKLVLSRLLLLD